MDEQGAGKASEQEARLAKDEEREIKRRLAEIRSKSGSSRRGTAIMYASLLVIFLAIAMVVFAPITASMGSVTPGTGGDSYQNLWGMWWVSYSTFTLHESMWHTGLLFPPLGASLVFQTMAPLASLLSAPFQAIGTVFAYNAMFLLSFAVSGLTMFILAEYLTRNRYAAFLAGLVFSFSAFHFMAAIAHIDWMFIAWVPLSVYFFLRMIREEGKLWSAVGLGISLVLAIFMGDMEQGLMVAEVLVLIFLAYLIFSRSRAKVLSRGFWKSIGVFIVVMLVVGSFAFVPIIQALAAPGALATLNQGNSAAGMQLWSDNALSFFLPNPLNSLFTGAALSYGSIYMGDLTEEVSYVGYVVIALVLYGIYRDRRRARLWIVLALLFGWLALGPNIMVGSAQTSVPGIYSAYSGIPLLNILREPGRFDLIVSMALAVLAAFGLSSLLANKSRGKAFAIVAVISVLFLAESTGIIAGPVTSMTTTSVKVPQVYYGVAQAQGNFSVLNLPAIANPYAQYPALYPGMATFYTSVTHKPTVSGYVTRMNSTQQAYLFNIPLAVQTYNLQNTGGMAFSSPIKQNFTDQTLLTLYNYNVGLVAVDTGAFNSTGASILTSYLDSVFGTPVASNGTLAYGTAAAVNRTLFRSYVAYPLQTQWGSQQVPVNGSRRTLWVPIGYGAVIVYAPYANTSGIQQKILGGVIEPINTTVSFQAMSSGYPTRLYLQSVDAQGSSRTLARFNLTGSLRDYSANTVLYSGPRAAGTLLFVSDGASNASYALMDNITFSEAR